MQYTERLANTADTDAVADTIQRLEARCATCPRCPDAAGPLEHLRLGLQPGSIAGATDAAIPELLGLRENCLQECPHPTDAGALERELPRLILELRAHRHATAGASRADVWYSNPDRTGTLRGLLPRLLERLVFSAPGRWVGKLLLGSTPAGGPRPVARPPFRQQVEAPRAAASRRGAPAAALFHTCQVDYFEPAAGWACLEVLEGHGVAVEVPVQSCCGLSHLQSGDLEGASVAAAKNVEALLPLVRSGHTVVVASSSCADMLRIHAPRLLGTQAAAAVAAAVQPWSDYLQRRRLTDPDAPEPLDSPPRRVAWLSAPAGVSKASLELLAGIPGLEVVDVPALSGVLDTPSHSPGAGRSSAAILGTGLEAIRAAGADVMVADCRFAARAVEAALGTLVLHPAELLRGRYAAYRRPEPPVEMGRASSEAGAPLSALEAVLLRQRWQEDQARATLLRRPDSPGATTPL